MEVKDYRLLHEAIAIEKASADFLGFSEDSTRRYSDYLWDLVEEDAIDCKKVLQTLIYWASEDEIKTFCVKSPDMNIIDCTDYELAKAYLEDSDELEAYEEHMREAVEAYNNKASEIGVKKLK